MLIPVGRMLYRGLLLKNCKTCRPLEACQVKARLDLSISWVCGALMIAATTAILVTFYPRAVEELRRGNRRAMGFDALMAVAAAAGMAMLWRQFEAALAGQFHAQALLSMSSPSLIASAAPAVAGVTEAVDSLFIRAA